MDLIFIDILSPFPKVWKTVVYYQRNYYKNFKKNLLLEWTGLIRMEPRKMKKEEGKIISLQ